jgi:hypothetical protein
VRATGKLVDSPELAKLGLEPPRGKAVARSAAADDSKVMTETVLIGEPQTDGRLYALREYDRSVIELSPDAARGLGVDTALIRSRTIFDIPISDVAGVELEGPARQVIVRGEGGAMTLTEPPGFGVDNGLALELCDALRELSAERWASEKDDGTFGLAAPTVTARLLVRKGTEVERHVLRLGRPAPSGVYASVEEQPGVFIVPRRLVETLSSWVIDRGAFTMDPASTRRIIVKTKDRELVLANQGGAFVQTDSGPPLSPESVQRVVDTLSQLRAEGAVDTAAPRPEYGLSEPELTVAIERDAAGAAPLLFSVGSGDSWRGMSVHYAAVRGVPATFAIARSAVRAILDVL